MNNRPWETEPEKLDGEHLGLPWAMRRGSSGAWCGYVGVPSSHSLFNISYNQTINNPPKHLIEREVSIDNIGAINLFRAGRHGVPPTEACDLVLLLDAHGGLTYSGNMKHWPELPLNFWWFGFDCAHAGDLSPKYAGHSDDIYRDVEYVKTQCENLALQLVSWPEGKVILYDPSSSEETL